MSVRQSCGGAQDKGMTLMSDMGLHVSKVVCIPCTFPHNMTV